MIARRTPYQPKAVLERFREALRRLLWEFRSDFEDPRLIKVLSRTVPTPIAALELEDCTYVLYRLPVSLKRVLSHREAQIALLIHEGLTNKDIAQKLGLSARTVGTHLRRIYSRLSIGSRVKLARLAIELRPDSFPGLVAPH